MANVCAHLCSSGAMEPLIQQFMDMWKGPVAAVPSAEAEEEARQASQAANQGSRLHQLDLRCRRQLSQAMQHLNSNQVSK